MNRTYKKADGILLLALFFLGISAGVTHAANLTVEGKEDAALNFGVAVFAKFVAENDPTNTLLTVLPTDPQFLSKNDAYAFAQNISNWSLQSAGNIWSATDLVVGESLSNLDAGTYRIAPVGGTYMYDSWDWSPQQNHYWWELHIRADSAYDNNGQLVSSFDDMLGSTTGYDSADLAFQAVQGDHRDITVAQGGSLNFWIWDWNSVDNAGGLTFSVTRVPEPSALLLLVFGLPGLVWRARR